MRKLLLAFALGALARHVLDPERDQAFYDHLNHGVAVLGDLREWFSP